MNNETAALILGSSTSREYIRKNHIGLNGVTEACDLAADLLNRIVFCKDCRKHGVSAGLVKDICPLLEFRGKPQGHEFDYQYCVYGEKANG